jgi:hypothetical protein
MRLSMSTRTIRTYVIGTLLGVCSATALQLSAQSPAGSDDAIRKLESRIAELERQINSPLTVTAPFTVLDKNRNAILRVEGNVKEGADLTLGGSSSGTIALNTARSAAALSVMAAGQPEVRLVSSDSDTGVEVVKSGSAKTLNSTRLFRIAFLGRTDDADDAGAVVTVNNALGDPVAALAAKASGGEVQVGSADGAATGAELSVNAEGGRLRVFDKSGAAVGGVFGSAKGGGLALTGPGGGFSAVSLGVNTGGGAVRVYSASGGPARAALEADAATGGVTAYDQQGNPAATLASVTGGSGILQLLSGGTTMVEAGTTEDGLGLVRAGPATGGVIGTIVPPHTLMGRKQD